VNFRFAHNNFNVLDLEKSVAFYKKALNLKASRLHFWETMKRPTDLS
jgi:lactoylglutathione lyase